MNMSRTLFDLNIKDVSQCVMPGVKKSNDVELQLHESDATDQTEVGAQSRRGGPGLLSRKPSARSKGSTRRSSQGRRMMWWLVYRPPPAYPAIRSYESTVVN